MPRPSLRLLATHTPSSTPITGPPRLGTRRANRTTLPPISLLPPIPLYRRLLRLHRRTLNPEERVFGDAYLKAEWRRHRDVENPLQIVGFLTQWQEYGSMLASRGGSDAEAWAEGRSGFKDVGGEHWGIEGLLEKMNDQQVGQVWELYRSIRKRNDPEGLAEEEAEQEVVELDGGEKKKGEGSG